MVDDDAPVRNHANRLLSGLGYAVRVASDGNQALRLLTEPPGCDILFTDVLMPGMSGGGLAQAARLLLPRLPVVFATGYNTEPAVELLCRQGTAVLLLKPYRREAVALALRDAQRMAP